MRVSDVYPAERTFWALRFSRATGSAAMAAWLLLTLLAIVFASALPFFPSLAEASEIAPEDLTLSVVALVLLVPLSLAFGTYALVLFGRIDRRLAAGLGSVWLLISLILGALGWGFGLIAAITGDLAAGGLHWAIVAAACLTATFGALKLLVLSWIAAATWSIASADRWSFASARGFTPTLRRPLSVLRAAFGMPFYMAVGRQRGKLAASVQFALHNVLAGAFAVGVLSLFRGAPRSAEADEQGVLTYTAGVASGLAELSPADRDWLTASPAFPGPYFDEPLGLGVGVVLFAVTSIITVPLAIWLGRSARKQLTRNYSEARASDGRAPILFLRSFRDDRVRIEQTRRSMLNRLILRFGEPKTLDEVLLEVGAAYGPVCAIGNPYDPLPPFGAAREYLKDDEWRSAVKELAEEAQAIVIVVDHTEGVRWEVGAIRELKLEHRTLFLPSPALSHEERLAIAETLAPNARAALGDQSLIALSFDAEGGELFASKRHTRDAIQVTLTRFFLSRLGYPLHALARPNLTPERKRDPRQSWRLSPVLGWASALGTFALIIVGGAFGAPHWRQATPLWTAYLERAAQRPSEEPASEAPASEPAPAEAELERPTCDAILNSAPDSTEGLVCRGERP